MEGEELRARKLVFSKGIKTKYYIFTHCHLVDLLLFICILVVDHLITTLASKFFVINGKNCLWNKGDIKFQNYSFTKALRAKLVNLQIIF
jgi:hypothetical protein